MFDVFYIGKKPNLFPHEQLVSSIEHAQQLCRTRYFWIVNYLVDYTDFDFLWEPSPWEANQRHAWPSQWQKDSGTYLVPKNGYIETNYRKSPYLTSRVDMNFWEVAENATFENFDWSWHPDYSDPPYIYQFSSQWQKTGGPRYRMPGATQIKYTDQLRVTVRPNARAVFFVDHMNVESQDIYNQIQCKAKIVKSVRFFDNYFDILKRIARNARDYEHIWICSSICDYSKFDFNWHPEIWQGTMLHVFPSNEQKFGDTFYMHVPSFLERMDKVELLEWYNCSFNQDQIVSRLDLPVINHEFDSHVPAIQQSNFVGPAAIFANSNKKPKVPSINLWRPQTRTIIPLTDRGSVVLIPRDSVSDVKNQLYDYPYIDKSQRTNCKDDPLDIIFISNGESNAEKNWQHLKKVAQNISNRVVRVDGVNGRVAAYHAALKESQTPWAFCVFAKLEVNEKFNWSWQPDCLQEPKHYIFNAKNPINGLEYGHMAMIAYNKKLVLANQGQGLDFTLDQPHEVVPLLSGTAQYANDPWMAWRTAFREVIKLLYAPADVDRDYRLKVWKSPGKGTLAHWSQQGSLDAEEYFTQVNGDFNLLKKSYEWSWLRDYFLERHSLTLEITRSAI